MPSLSLWPLKIMALALGVQRCCNRGGRLAAGFFIVASRPNVATDGDPFSFNDERGGDDFSTGESGPLGKVSVEDEPVMSLGGF